MWYFGSLHFFLCAKHHSTGCWCVRHCASIFHPSYLIQFSNFSLIFKMGRSLFFISFFSPSIFLSISARVSSLMVGPIDNNITSVSAFVLLWWKEQIFIYLLNVTHSWQSTFCSWPAMGPTKKCTTHNHPHTHTYYWCITHEKYELKSIEQREKPEQKCIQESSTTITHHILYGSYFLFGCHAIDFFFAPFFCFRFVFGHFS